MKLNKKLSVVILAFLLLVIFSVAYTFSGKGQIYYSTIFNPHLVPDNPKYSPGQKVTVEFTTESYGRDPSFSKPITKSEIMIYTELRNVSAHLMDINDNVKIFPTKIKSDTYNDTKFYKIYFEVPKENDTKLKAHLEGETADVKGKLYLASPVYRNYYRAVNKSFFLKSIVTNVGEPSLHDCRLIGNVSFCAIQNKSVKSVDRKKFRKNEVIIAKFDLDQLAKKVGYDPYQACIEDNLAKTEELNIPEHYNKTEDDFPCSIPLPLNENHTAAVYGKVKKDPVITMRIFPSLIKNISDMEKNMNKSKLVYELKGEIID